MYLDELTPEERRWLADEDRRTDEVIRKHGLVIQYVSGDDATRTASFAYTVGLHGIQRPELLIFSVTMSTANGVLNDIAARMRSGKRLRAGQMLEFERWRHRVVVERVPNPERIAFAANRYYRLRKDKSVALWQLTYDDLSGRFPWDPNYSNDDWIQPRPGEFDATVHS